jgi:hypothetical protein
VKGVHHEKFFKKGQVTELSKSKVAPPMLFYGKKLSAFQIEV